MNGSGAMEAQQLGPAGRDGRQDNREVLLPMADQTARRLAEPRRRPRAIAVLLEQARMTRRFVHAPGPRGLPFLGNLLDFRRDALRYYSEWSRQYGDIVAIKEIGANAVKRAK